MTTFTTAPLSFDFWEFVCCGICHLPFHPDTAGPPPVPFWMTECGHVICNNHLNADQSCAQCGSQSVQVAPLQRDTDPLLSDMFRSVPHGFDSVANAAKFQLETLAALTRHYRNKCGQQRALLHRLRERDAEYKSNMQRLQAENDHLRRLTGYGAEPSGMLNRNGKRSLTYRNTGSMRASSSPHSSGHMAPERLTLPPAHRPPRASASMSARPVPAPVGVPGSSRRLRQSDHRGEGDPSAGTSRAHMHASAEVAPGSSRFAQQFAYAPPDTAPLAPPQAILSHQQRAPARMATLQVAGPAAPMATSGQARSKFRPAGVLAQAGPGGVHTYGQAPPPQPTPSGSRARMPPPPPPLRPTVGQVPQQRQPRLHAPTPVPVRSASAASIEQWAEAAAATRPAARAAPMQAAVPQTPGMGPERFGAGQHPGVFGARQPSGRAQAPAVSLTALQTPRGAQRAPFVPGQGAFA